MTVRRTLSACGLVANAAGAILFGGIASGASAATSFVPNIGLSGSWTNNIDMAPSPGQQAGEVWVAEPGFDFAHDSALENATVDYTLHGLFFSNGQHDFLHSGNLLSQTHVLPDWFELDIAGLRTQGAASAALPASTFYLFPVSNFADYTTGLVKPILQHSFKSVEVVASYTRGITEERQLGVSDAPQFKGNEQNSAFTASSVDNNARVTWSASYQREQEDYESPNSELYLFEQATGQLGVLTTSSLRLIAQGGKESNPQLNISEGGLGSPFWAAGFDWGDGPLNELKLLAGHRFFGKSYDALWRRQRRLLSLEVSYHEKPTTQDESMLDQPLSIPVVPVVPNAPTFTQLSQEVFLDKSLTGSVTITGRLTEIGVAIEDSKQSYFALGALAPTLVSLGYQDSERSATLYVTRHLGPFMDLNISATVSRLGLMDTTTTDSTEQQYSTTLTRHLGKHSSIYLRALYLKELEPFSSVTTEVATLGFKIYFGNPPNLDASSAATGDGR